MRTIRIDDRTKEQKRTHYVLVTATDRFLSGWGHASGGTSKCAWACNPNDGVSYAKLLHWVKSRSDMKYINLRFDSGKGWYPKCAHLHIYVVDKNHTSQNS
jgi:hypothetical protein